MGESGSSVEKASLDRLTAELAGVPGLALAAGQPLARRTTLRIGGPAALLAEVGSERALVRLLEAVARVGGERSGDPPFHLPFHLLGLGSNILVPDEGLPGVVARLGGELKRVRLRGLRLSAGAGAPLAVAARKAAQAGLAGLEALAGFPSTVGGAVYMNAGCYGTEIRDVLCSARLVERDGRRHRITVAELGATYRATRLKESGAIVTRALFELTPGEPQALVARMEELNARRWASLPSGQANAGSIFKNPPGDFAGRLLEQAGMKGTRVGGAEVSPKHANVIVNTGGATASDVVALMRTMRAAVVSRFGLCLEPEILLLGPLSAAFEAEA